MVPTAAIAVGGYLGVGERRSWSWLCAHPSQGLRSSGPDRPRPGAVPGTPTAPATSFATTPDGCAPPARPRAGPCGAPGLGHPSHAGPSRGA